MLNNLLLPAKQKHSITEASIALFLVHAPVDYSKFSRLIGDSAIGTNYATYNAKVEKNFRSRYNATTETVVTENPGPSRETGFTIESFNSEGQPDYTIQSESGQTNVFSLHSFNYDSWGEFIGRFNRDMPIIAKIQAGLFVKHIGMGYVDQFFWNDISHPPLKEIFVESDYIPKRLLGINKDWDYKFTAHTEDDNGMGVIESVIMNISRQPNSTFILSISHSVIAVLKHPVELTEEFINNECTRIANSLHGYNKKFLISCLNPEICEQIGLKL